MTTDTLTAGLAAKEEGQHRATMNADLLYRESLRATLRGLADSGRRFTSDDVRIIAGDPPPGFSPNIIGAMVTAAAKRHQIEPVGYGTTTRRAGRGRMVMVWRGRA